MRFRSFLVLLLLAATFTSGVLTTARAADQPNSQPPAQGSPEKPFPIDTLPPEVVGLLEKAAEGDPSVIAAPAKPAAEPEDGSSQQEDVPAPQAPPVPQTAPAPAPPQTAPPMPGMPTLGPGMTFQPLRGVLHKQGEEQAQQPAAAEQEMPNWLSDVLPSQNQIDWRAPGAAALQEPLGGAVTGLQPPTPGAATMLRQPTKEAPATPPDGLPLPKYPTLIDAVKAGDVTDMENHIWRGVDLDATNPQGDSAVMVAAREGQAKILELLLDYGAHPATSNDQTHQAPVVAAAKNKHWDCVRLLREFGAVYSLSQAAYYGDMQSMEDMLEASPDVLGELDLIRNTPMHSAAIGGHAEAIRYLIEKGAPLSPSNSEQDTPLAFAVKLNKAEAVKTLVAAGVDVNEPLKGGETVLHRKARDNDTETIELVLSLGGEINAPDETGATPLHVAAVSNHPQMIGFLLDHQARVNPTDDNGETPLYKAARVGAGAALETLLDRGADMTAPDAEGATPLHAAAKGGKKQTLLALLERGADSAAVTNRKATLLHSAVQGAGARPLGQDRKLRITNEMGDRIDLINMLIAKGLPIDARDEAGMTPLHYAAQNGQRALCHVLLTGGAAVDATEMLGRTPLLCALEKSFTFTAETLVDGGANVQKADNLGRTPLHVASQTAGKELIQRFLNLGADIQALDSNGWTVLHYAADKGTADVIRLLLAMGASIDAKDIAGRLPLHLAADRDAPDVIKVLAGNGSDLAAEDFKGRQPLLVATGEGHKDTVEILLQHGADPNAADDAGYTALHIAAELGHRDLIRPLIYHRGDTNLRNNNGKTPSDLAMANEDRRTSSLLRTNMTADFDRALKQGDVEKVERMVSANRALVNRRQSGQTALYMACETGNKQLVEVLLGYGANIALSESVRNKPAPLHAAAQKGRLDIVQLLLMMGANPEVLDPEKQTPADLAEKHGHRNVAEAIRKHAEELAKAETPTQSPGSHGRKTLFSLIAAGDAETVRKMLDTYSGAVSEKFLSLAPAQLAVTMGKKDILALLLERGANPNQVSNANTRRTLLHEAASRGLREICELLVSAGADPDARDSNGKTPADLAGNSGFADLAKLLKERAVRETT